MKTLADKIEEQEKKDRYVATKCLNHIFHKGKDLKIKPTQIIDYVDLNCSVVNTKDKTIQFNVEIKERFKSVEQLEKYPNAELKVDKYKRMKSVTPSGTKLLYMVLLNNEKMLLFDLNKLDWDKVEKRNWKIKKTQMNPNSDYVITPTYFIPYAEAICTLDCAEYFKEYEE